MAVGVDYLIVNIARRQYLDPCQFGESSRGRYVIDGHHAIALGLLVCNFHPSGGSPEGTWHGDGVYLVGDSGPIDQYGVATATDREPWRNLHAMARAEFEDISLAAIIMLLTRRGGMADELAKKAQGPYEGEVLLKNLGDILSSDELRERVDSDEDCNPDILGRALAHHVGRDWEAKYLELVSKWRRR